jgi:hypothetical protein
MTQIRDAMVEFNPWWKGDFQLDYKDRRIYSEIRKFMSQSQILAFTGLRRVGKTTLMMKLAKDAMDSGLDPRKILYFSFDEFREDSIRTVLDEYSSLMKVDVGEGDCLVLLDEIQKVEGWDGQLKALYDRVKGRARIVISGSESLFIRQRSRETLAGRLYEFQVKPLTFAEYLGFRGVKHQPVDLYKKELLKAVDEFMLTQGFPELVGVTDKTILKKHISESIIDRVLYKDLPTLVTVRDVEVLRSIMRIIMEEPGQLVQLSDLAGQLGVSRQKVSNYLVYLEDSFLVRRLYNFSRNRRKVERKLKKYYPAMVSVDLLFKEDDQSRSKAFEWMAVSQLDAEFFWRDSYKNEVDIVIAEKEPVPVEVKHGKVELSGLRAFMRKFGVKAGFVITRDEEGRRKLDGGTVNLVPAYEFLLRREKGT